MTWIAVGAAVAAAGFWVARRRRGRNSGAAADARRPLPGGDAGAHAHGTLKHGNQIRDVL